MTKEVRAAGGLVTVNVNAVDLVLVVHRPHYNDWSLPKGKLDPGETDLECARREVLEETGLVVLIGEELPNVRYTDHRGRPKVVRYWRMTLNPSVHQNGTIPEFAPNDEVDEIRWLQPSEAAHLLSYQHDRELVLLSAPEQKS